MALYRLSAEIIGRGKGYSATAAAAYRAGERIVDERTGAIHDYRRRSGVLHTEILAPENAPDWARDRAQLWNAVERAERRGDAQLSRQLILALPHELTDAQREELVRDFVQSEFVRRGMVADIALHAPDAHGDARNYHAHVLLTMRRIEGEGFGNKERSWNSDDLLRGWRHQWAQHQNRALERAGVAARVDHRRYEDQGIDRQATQHLGKAANQMEARGQKTRIGEQNRETQARNAERAQREQDLKIIHLEIEREKRRLRDEQREAIKKEFSHGQPIAPPKRQNAPPDPAPAREAFNDARPAAPRETLPDPPADIWDRDQEERDWQEKMIDAALAHGEAQARRKRPPRDDEGRKSPAPDPEPPEEDLGTRLHDWAMQQRDEMRHRHLDEASTQEDVLGGLFASKEHEIRRFYESAILQTRLDLQEIEARQRQTGLRGLMERLAHPDLAARAEGLCLTLENAQARFAGAQARIEAQKQEKRDQLAAQQAREQAAQERKIAQVLAEGRIPETPPLPLPVAERESSKEKSYSARLSPEIAQWISHRRDAVERKQEARYNRLMKELDRELFPARQAIENRMQPRIGNALRELKAIEARRKAPGLGGRFARMQHPDDRERAEAVQRELEAARAERKQALLELERQKHNDERAHLMRAQNAQDSDALDVEIKRVVQSGRLPVVSNDNPRTAGTAREGAKRDPSGQSGRESGRGGRRRER